MALEAAPQADRVCRLAQLLEARLQRAGRLGRYTLAEVAQHCTPHDGWIVVDSRVYDITPHVVQHPGWTSGCGTSQLLAILRTLGTDCSEEVRAVHSTRALLQLQPFLIGVLVVEGEGQDGGGSSSSSEAAACQGDSD
ncbi:cytochrome b5 [Chlorella sorokiniana]|uniref:Cytochrome b5 n=1 Tax=Chlorella sorokiniana TaxID=3076 RepID=A0A2P6TWJ1_CHLSO|nr:cytochrome b5 [Chlorella sorokiniana]|eukprot:PRW58439.1 cytochrome b5 [Chlorella sorokiniana]